MPDPVTLERKSASARHAKNGRFRVMIFRPRGYYPAGTICSPIGQFHADDEIAFSVTRGTPWPEELPYSEVNWLGPDDIRLLGSMMLTEPFLDGPRCCFDPVPFVIPIVERDLDLSYAGTAVRVKRALLAATGQPEFVDLQTILDDGLSGGRKPFSPDNLSLEMQPEYLAHISSDDHVLVRGLHALIKADMLSRHAEFWEEAAIATYISMEASFELVRRRLRASGIIDPTAREAGEWLYRTFDEPLGAHGADGMRYFEEFYAQRIQTRHPGSRFGDAPYAPIMADDYFHLRTALPGVFGYLAIGRHSRRFELLCAERRAIESA